MNQKKYRICLLSLLIIAVVGGIFYYRNLAGNKAQAVDGTFVRMFENDNLDDFFRGRNAFKIVGTQVSYGG